MRPVSKEADATISHVTMLKRINYGTAMVRITLVADSCGRAAGLRLWRDEQTLFAPPGLDLIESPGDGRIGRRQKHEITPDLGFPDTKTLAKTAHHVLYLL
ncbi:MAG: hypothetical protein M3065_04585 [Actinomycetota bacterium]|nr:hypothetical protein [Actinomycetota bacterium]